MHEHFRPLSANPLSCYRMLVWITLLVCVGVSSAELEVINQWNFFDFDIPFGYPTNENYSTSQSPSTGIEIAWERIFLALPRFMPGAPLSLAFIPRNRPGGYGELSPKLQVCFLQKYIVKNNQQVSLKLLNKYKIYWVIL